MSKDPAFLFYPGDWQGGTMYYTAEQKGMYMDLLILQFNTGAFTEEQAKQVLSICFDVAWPKLKQKFVQEGDLFYNLKLRTEIEKRKKFTESRRNNGLKDKKTVTKPEAYAKHMHEHMHKHMENENENRNDNEFKDKEGVQGEKTGIMPGHEDMGMDIPSIKVGSVIQLISAVQQISLTPEQVKQMWSAFKGQHFTGEKNYKSISDIYSHFINWAKSQKIKDAKSVTKAISGRSSGTVSYVDKLADRYGSGGQGDTNS